MYGPSSGGDKCMHSDHYDTKQGAKAAAKRMGVSGCHSMSCNGKKVYMPGSKHSEYMDMQENGFGNIPGL